MKESPAKSALKTPKDKVVDKDTSSETRSETDRSEGSETQSMSPAPEHDEKKGILDSNCGPCNFLCSLEL